MVDCTGADMVADPVRSWRDSSEFCNGMDQKQEQEIGEES